MGRFDVDKTPRGFNPERGTDWGTERSGVATTATFEVYCHVCTYPNVAIPRNQARLIGSAHFGGLWHCHHHFDATPEQGCRCPRGDWTEKAPEHSVFRPNGFDEPRPSWS